MKLVIFLTQRCNFRCKHCLNMCPYNQELSLERYKKIIDLLTRHNLKSITFTGGEPTIHRNFKEIVNYTAIKGVPFLLVSNGFMYKKYAFLIDYVPKYFRSIYFSLEGTEKIHDENRTKGSFRQVMEAIDFFKNRGVSVKINFTLTKYNVGQMEDVLDILSKKRVDEVHIASVIQNEVNKDLVLDIAIRRKIFWNSSSLSNKYRMRILCTNSCYNYGGGFFCTILDDLDTIYINQRGELIYCCDIRDPYGKIGVLTEKNLKKLLDKKSELTNKIRTERLCKMLYLELPEIQEHSCEFCNNYFKETL